MKMKNETIRREDARAKADELYKKYYPLIGSFTNQMYNTSKREEYESRCWNRMLSVAQRRKFEKVSPECERSFLLEVFRLVYLEQLRKYRRDAKAITLWSLEKQAAKQNNNPRELAANRELVGAIVAFVNTMPHPSPKIFYYSFLEGRKSTWISKKMKMRRATVRVRLHRIRRKIMERCPKCY